MRCSHLCIHHWNLGVGFVSILKTRNHRRTCQKRNPKSGKPHTHNMSMSLTFHTIEVDSGLVLAVGSTLVQPHFNMNSCRPDSLKLHFPHVKDLVPSALHLSFVISEKGSFVECINPMPPGICTVNSRFFFSSEWSSLSSEFANSKSYIYIYIYTISNISTIWAFIPLSQVTLSPKPPLVFPACINPNAIRTPLDVATNAGHLRVARCLLESRGARGAGHTLPLPVLPQVRGSWSNVGNGHCVHFLSCPVFFNLCGNLK